MASMSKSLAQTNKSLNGIKATKRYRPEGDVGEAKETAHFSHHRRVKRPSLIYSANWCPGRKMAGASLMQSRLTEEERRHEHH